MRFERAKSGSGTSVRAVLRLVYVRPERLLRGAGLEDADGKLYAHPEHAGSKRNRGLLYTISVHGVRILEAGVSPLGNTHQMVPS